MDSRSTILDELVKLEGFDQSQRARIGFAAAKGIIQEAELIEKEVVESDDLTTDEKLSLKVQLLGSTALAIATIVSGHIQSLGHDPSRPKAKG